MFWDRLAHLFEHFWTDSTADVLLLVALMVGWRTYKHLSVSGRVVLGFVHASVVLMVLTYVLAFWSQKNHFVFTLQALAEFCCFGAVYLIEIKAPTTRRVVGATMGIFLVVFLLASDPAHMNDLLIGTARLLLIGFVLAYFWSLLSDMRVARLLDYPPFWISIAVLLNGAGTTFIYIFNRVTLSSVTRNPYFVWYWGVTQVFLCLFYGLLAYSFWVSQRIGRTRPTNRMPD